MNNEDPRQCWQTPDDFFRVVDREFLFQVDVAATEENAKCGRYISNSFEVGWFSFSYSRLSAWCNPGFREMRPWVERAYEQTQEVVGSVACVLGPLGRAEWLSDFCYKHATEIRIVTPRIQFVPPPGINASTNRGDCVLVVFRKKLHANPAHVFFWNWKEGNSK